MYLFQEVNSDNRALPCIADPVGDWNTVGCHTLMCLCNTATVEKIVKEILPKDIRLATNTLDLLLDCCGGDLNARKPAASEMGWTCKIPVMFSQSLKHALWVTQNSYNWCTQRQTL